MYCLFQSPFPPPQNTNFIGAIRHETLKKNISLHRAPTMERRMSARLLGKFFANRFQMNSERLVRLEKANPFSMSILYGAFI